MNRYNPMSAIDFEKIDLIVAAILGVVIAVTLCWNVVNLILSTRLNRKIEFIETEMEKKQLEIDKRKKEQKAAETMPEAGGETPAYEGPMIEIHENISGATIPAPDLQPVQEQATEVPKAFAIPAQLAQPPIPAPPEGVEIVVSTSVETALEPTVMPVLEMQPPARPVVTEEKKSGPAPAVSRFVPPVVEKAPLSEIEPRKAEEMPAIESIEEIVEDNSWISAFDPKRHEMNFPVFREQVKKALAAKIPMVTIDFNGVYFIYPQEVEEFKELLARSLAGETRIRLVEVAAELREIFLESGLQSFVDSPAA